MQKVSLQQRVQQYLEEYEMSNRYACPYCTLGVNLKFTMINNDTQMNVKLRQAQCPNCFGIIIECSKQNISYSSITTGHGNKIKKNETQTEYRIVYPYELNVCIDDKVPKELKEGLNKANTIKNYCLRSAAARVRATLEDFLVLHLGITEVWSLDGKIKQIKFPWYVNYEMLEAIKLCGNYGMHVQIGAEVTLEEITFVILKLKELFEAHFIKAVNEERMIKEIKAKGPKEKK